MILERVLILPITGLTRNFVQNKFRLCNQSFKALVKALMFLTLV